MDVYKTIKVDRLFHGYASVRDYQLKEAIDNGRGLKIICGNEYILIDWCDLGGHYKNDEIFTSRHYPPNHPHHHYKLVDFDWQTFRKKTKSCVQFDLFQSLIKL